MSDWPLLEILHSGIQSRCDETARHRDWPCHKGCSRCCRRLASIPNFTRAEWKLAWEHYLNLPQIVRFEIHSRLPLFPAEPPYTCPFLDLQTESCLIYESRPVACRTYGFYVERDQGLYCREMQAQAEQGQWDGVVWGNAAAVEAKLEQLGERKDLDQWFQFEGA